MPNSVAMIRVTQDDDSVPLCSAVLIISKLSASKRHDPPDRCTSRWRYRAQPASWQQRARGGHLQLVSLGGRAGGGWLEPLVGAARSLGESHCGVQRRQLMGEPWPIELVQVQQHLTLARLQFGYGLFHGSRATVGACGGDAWRLRPGNQSARCSAHQSSMHYEGWDQHARTRGHPRLGDRSRTPSGCGASS